MAKIRLIVSDFLLAFMWVSSGALNKLFVNRVLGWGHEPRGEIMKATLSIINMFFFAFLGKISKGGAYNPLTVLAGAISGDFSRFLFTVGARIPAQVRFFWFCCWINQLGLSSCLEYRLGLPWFVELWIGVLLCWLKIWAGLALIFWIFNGFSLLVELIFLFFTYLCLNCFSYWWRLLNIGWFWLPWNLILLLGTLCDLKFQLFYRTV